MPICPGTVVKCGLVCTSLLLQALQRQYFATDGIGKFGPNLSTNGAIASVPWWGQRLQ